MRGAVGVAGSENNTPYARRGFYEIKNLVINYIAFRYFGGFTSFAPDKDNRFSIAPFVSKKLEHASAFFCSPSGKVMCEWKLEAKAVFFRIELPENEPPAGLRAGLGMPICWKSSAAA